MNSPNNSAAPSRLSKWLRRLLWIFITLVSLLVVYYQWENRRSARELAEARAQMIALIGTDRAASSSRANWKSTDCKPVRIQLNCRS